MIVPKIIRKKCPFHMRKTLNDIEKIYDKIENELLVTSCSNNNRQTPLIVWKLQIYLQLVIHRTVDIVSTISYSCANFKISVSFILLRSLYENVTVLYDAHRKVENALQNRNIEEINDTLNLLIFRNTITPNSPYNPESFIDICNRIDSDIPNYSKQYLDLCEFVHPNYDAMMELYGKPLLRYYNVLNFIKSIFSRKQPTYSIVSLSNKNGFKKYTIKMLFHLLDANLLLLTKLYDDFGDIFDDISDLSDSEYERIRRSN